jgi:hypothetical protein
MGLVMNEIANLGLLYMWCLNILLLILIIPFPSELANIRSSLLLSLSSLRLAVIVIYPL